MARPPASDPVVRDTLKNLVRQFSQELCFYRELIQNAVDAGSQGVDVTLSWLDDANMAEIQVADYGEGMDRAVIDNQLTRLFSSSKENDYTKIGKFGIGFVSVFAIAPEAVAVETGKGGEYWRVLFKPDGTFERLVLSQPVEGTRVKLYKKMAASAFKDFVKRSRETVIYWCRHAAAEVRFQGETVNQPFDLDSPVRIACEEQGTSVVLALTEQSPAFFGFYNQGITLLEGYHDYIPGVSFKIKSRYLEHTLTRDNVMQDENYAKAMAIVEARVDSSLLPEFLARLEEAATDPDRDRWQRLFALGQSFLSRAWTGDGRHRKVLRCLGGPPVSYADLARSATNLGGICHELGGRGEPRVAFDLDAPPTLLAALQSRGVVVLEAADNHRIIKALKELGLHGVRATSILTAPLAADAPAGGLLDAAIDALHRCGVTLHSGSWAAFDAAAADRPFLMQRVPSPLALLDGGSVLDEDQRPGRWPLSLVGGRHVVVNLAHPLVTRLIATWEARPGFAVYQMAKLLCLADGIHPTLEERLLRWAFEHRGR